MMLPEMPLPGAEEIEANITNVWSIIISLFCTLKTYIISCIEDVAQCCGTMNVLGNLR